MHMCCITQHFQYDSQYVSAAVRFKIAEPRPALAEMLLAPEARSQSPSYLSRVAVLEYNITLLFWH